MSDVLERFLRYVQVDSQADPNSDTVPSTPEQHDMARMLESELLELGLEGVSRDEHAYVYATLPASAGAEELPALGLIAHIDSAFSAPGHGVRPQIVHYEGPEVGSGDLEIGVVEGRRVAVSVEEVPLLAEMAGEDIVCSDGSTLLSCDDKGGVAAIMALLARLVANPELAHPTLKIAFVPDEEIGHGAGLLDPESFGAKWAYTVDGEQLGQISYETFNAMAVEVKITGVSVHPGSAKDIMVNSITVFRDFDASLPGDERPENTDGYQGYFHCNHVEGREDGLRAQYILRDFEREGMERRCEIMREAARAANERWGEDTVALEFRNEYPNMKEYLTDSMFLVDHAIEANREAGIEPFIEAIRGGTDGSQLTERGLPCPNLATGCINAHSVREFVPVSALEKTVDMLQALVARFARPQED